MSKTNDELEARYKNGLPMSHAQGLREVYQVGRTDEQEAMQDHLKQLEQRLFSAQAREAELDAKLTDAAKERAELKQGNFDETRAADHQKNLDEVRRMASAGEPLISTPPAETADPPPTEMTPPSAAPTAENPPPSFGGVEGAPTEPEKAQSGGG